MDIANDKPSSTQRRGAQRRAKHGRRGRPATNPDRWPRTYREMLARARGDRAKVAEANRWARERGLELDPLAVLAEQAGRELHATPAQTTELPDAGPVIDGTYTQVAAAEPAPELDDQAAAEPAPELDDQAAAEP
ncbi:hypothetical protein LY474_40545, partial [Myxococcus stipitatus]|uniref:hypothetical protein n=1 Tax=Myxococcus stipitatus TaxID=83455 RepID=UPI001F368C07